MPFVMLSRTWPGTFRRTVTVNGKKRQLAFSPGEPVQLKPAEVAELRADIGAALQPVEIDSKGRPRVITDEVDVAESVSNEPAKVN